MITRCELWLTFMVLCVSYFLPVNCNSSWLTNLPDSQKINTLSLIGTHDSATHKVRYIPLAWTQNMSITEQLEAGVRVFDMRLRLVNNDFMMYHGLKYLGMSFGDVMKEISAFLASNPNEFIIMFMQEEWKPKNTTLTGCQILRKKYMAEYPDLFIRNWSVRNTIGQHRGKILLAKANGGFSLCTTRLLCREQNNWAINATYTRNDKWNDIMELQNEIFNSNGRNRCYINYLSGNGGVLSPPRSICCKFNPLDWIIGGFQKVPKMNELMLDYFRNPKNTLYIIMADFPSTQLIDKITSSN